MIFLGTVFMSAAGQFYRTMASPLADTSLQVLFGKAFLAGLQRGDLETAKLFARAFLLWTPALSKCAAVVTLNGAS